MRNRFTRFEEMAERLVEGSLARLFDSNLGLPQIMTLLARTVEDHARDAQAPDYLRLLLNPLDREQLLQAEPTLERLLAEQVVALARRSNLGLNQMPVVELVADPGTRRQAVSIEASVGHRPDQQTQVLNVASLRRRAGQQPDGKTYLIIEGQRHVPLVRVAYTVGRRMDCDIVLSDPRVSRQHAQLRWRFGRYVLYDLGSSTGTTVNGHPITEAVLEPGDVFSLGGVDIIYGRDAQDEVPVSDEDTTRAWPRPGNLDSP